MNKTSKILLSIGAVGSAASIAGLGTFATFTSTTSASQALTSGTVTIALGTAGSATNRLTIGASGLVPGDTIQRAFNLSNTGNQTLASIALTTTASPASLLDTDATNGLQMVIDKCPIAWVESATAPYTYTCASPTVVVATQRVIGSNIPMAGLAALTNGGTDYLRATLTLPSGAPNTLQNQASTISYSFVGTQRAATNQ